MTYQVLVKRESRYPLDQKKIKKMVEEVLREQGLKGNVEVSLAVVGDRKMRQLNLKYRKIDQTTDVLAFPQEVAGRTNSFVNPPDEVLRLGDIVISYPQVVVEAAAENKLVEEKIDELIRHGLSNLIGIG